MDYNFLESSLKNYFEILSAKTPIPGGGSAVCCLASLSCSLLNMVLNYTIGKKGYEKYEQEIIKIKEENDKILKECLNYIEDDSRIYEKIDNAMKNRIDTEEYLKLSVNLHLNVCEYMFKIVKFCEILIEKGNKNLISDTGISNIFAFSSFLGAKMNILINLKYIKDENFKEGVKRKLEEIEGILKDKSRIINERVIEKIGG
ncbi:MAG: cyclodeaminase/cyclohydrolase family protein [Candidatus Omnitrophica bacterium]|nr:cyclodeaminase/cyclohydrolase family protein [Candidatus Omnitrophota bacterium]